MLTIKFILTINIVNRHLYFPAGKEYSRIQVDTRSRNDNFVADTGYM